MLGKWRRLTLIKCRAAFLAGYEAAILKQHTDELSKLSLSNADYQKYIEHKQQARKQLKHGDQNGRR